MNIKLDSFSFDYGINSITYKSQVDTALPEASKLAPSDTISLPELEKLLALPNLGDFLTEILKPEIDNKDLLTPQGFQRALQDALTALRQCGEEGKLDAETLKLLNKAARVLSDEANLRDLLNMYLSVLYRG